MGRSLEHFDSGEDGDDDDDVRRKLLSGACSEIAQNN